MRRFYNAMKESRVGHHSYGSRVLPVALKDVLTVTYNALNLPRSIASGTVLQSTDYYPFGLAFSDANVTNNRYLYNGKELKDYTIGSSYLGTLDYGARHYDPRIGRWTVPDPYANTRDY